MAQIILHVEDEESDQLIVYNIFKEQMEAVEDENQKYKSSIKRLPKKPLYSKKYDITLIQIDNIFEAKYMSRKPGFTKNLIYYILDMDLPNKNNDYEDCMKIGGVDIRKHFRNIPELKKTPYTFCTRNEFKQIEDAEYYGEAPRILKEPEDDYKQQIREIFHKFTDSPEVRTIRDKYSNLKPWFKNNDLLNYFNKITEIGGKISVSDSYTGQLVRLIDELHGKYEGLLEHFDKNTNALSVIRGKICRTKPEYQLKEFQFFDDFGKKLNHSEVKTHFVEWNNRHETLAFWTKKNRSIKTGFDKITNKNKYENFKEIIDFQWMMIIKSWEYMNKCKHSDDNEVLLDMMAEKTDKYTAMMIFDSVMFSLYQLSKTGARKIV